MSIPTKGTRKITVDGQVFLWLIRRKVTYTQECYPDGHLHIAIQDKENKGSTLAIRTNRPHPKGLSYKDTDTPITPSDVELWIKQAIRLGWQPRNPGKTFRTIVESVKLQLLI